MIGVNGESSFESSLLRRAPGCEVWGYDFSVDNVRVSCPFFNRVPSLTCSFHQWGPEIKDDPALRDRAHFQPWALGGTDDHGEHSNPKYWTLDSLMRHNGTLRSISFLSQPSISSQLRHSMSYSISGHGFIDILKIDTEGAEFDALTAFVNEHAHGNLPVGQLQLEIHAQGDRGRSEYFLKWWESLEAAGLRPFSFEPNMLHLTGRDCAKPEVVEVRCFQSRLVSSLGPWLTGLYSLPVLVYQYPWQPRSRQRCFQLGGTAHHAWERLFHGRFLSLVRAKLAILATGRPDQNLEYLDP